MRIFFTIWFGQLVSLIGSSLTSFAVGVWVYQKNGSATEFAMITMFANLANLLAAPMAGVLVDRWDRRTTMLLSDLGSGLCTFFLYVMLVDGQPALWVIYLTTALNAVFAAFQVPAYSASITLLVPKSAYGRAGGLVQLAQGITRVLTPMAAGFLLGVVHLKGIILIDFLTFLIAVATLFAVRIPNPPPRTQTQAARGMWREFKAGLACLRERPGLLMLLVYFGISNFTLGLVSILATPLILTFADTQTLGMVISVCGIGMLLGSLLMSVWGGPKRLMRGVFAFQFISGAGAMAVGFFPSAPWVAAAGFCFFFSIPMVDGCSQAIWQKKIDPALQGRVFSVRRLVAMASLPAAYAVGGPLADYVFEPLMAEGGRLAPLLGPLIGGTGPGRGMGLLFILMGAVFLAVTLFFATRKSLVYLEDLIPDAADLPN